jgi:hypothetical protein
MNKYFSAAMPVAIGLAAAFGTTTTAAATGQVHFNTPQAAMRFLATASNHDNVAEIHKVTTPGSFKLFMGMRPELHNLHLQNCSATGHGDYICNLGYSYEYKNQTGKHWNNDASAQVVVAPAIDPGWYLYTFITCGGG